MFSFDRTPSSTAFLLLLLLPALMGSGCEDLPSDPTPSQRIFGRWGTSDTMLIAPHFRTQGVKSIDMQFESDGLFTVRSSGTPILNGSYLTRPSLSNGAQRSIEMAVTGGSTGNYEGAYRIVGDTMFIEIVPASLAGEVTTPDVEQPLPNSRHFGQPTVEFISRLVRIP